MMMMRRNKKKSKDSTKRQNHKNDGGAEDGANANAKGSKPSIGRPKSIAHSNSAAPTSVSLSSQVPSYATQLPNLPSISRGLPPFQLLDDDESKDNNRDNNSDSTISNNNWMKTPPRSNWNVQDDKLKPLSPFHPPPIPTCSTYIADDSSSSPSTITARISECLRKRSLIADYDDEAATAMVFSVDSRVFSISLYRGGKGAPVEVSTADVTGGDGETIGSVVSSSVCGGTSRNSAISRGSHSNYSTSSTTSTVMIRPDFSQGVIVECTRIRGDPISFHRDCQAVLLSARGESDGLDDQRKHPLASRMMGSSASSFSSLMLNKNVNATTATSSKNGKLVQGQRRKSSSSMVQLTCKSLEHSLNLIEKDRLDARSLGMEALVSLTDLSKTSLECAYLASLCVLGSPMNFPSSSASLGHHQNDEEDGNTSIQHIHDRILEMIISSQNENNEEHEYASSTPSIPHESTTATTIPQENTELASLCLINVQYKISLHRLAMQCVINALGVILEHSQEFPLLPKPQCEAFHTKGVLHSIALDLEGATRPPMTTQQLTSAHDATLAAKFLRLLVEYCHKNKISVDRDGNATMNHNDCYDSRSGSSSSRGDDTNIIQIINGLMDGTPHRPIMDLLQRAQTAGLSCHQVLQVETENALHHLGTHEN